MLSDNQVLDRRERDALAEVCRGGILYAQGRNMPQAYRTLLAQGLAFRSLVGLSATDKGREVSERVT